MFLISGGTGSVLIIPVLVQALIQIFGPYVVHLRLPLLGVWANTFRARSHQGPHRSTFVSLCDLSAVHLQPKIALHHTVSSTCNTLQNAQQLDYMVHGTMRSREGKHTVFVVLSALTSATDRKGSEFWTQCGKSVQKVGFPRCVLMWRALKAKMTSERSLNWAEKLKVIIDLPTYTLCFSPA